MNKRLSIIATEEKIEKNSHRQSKLERRQAAEEKFNQLWKENPRQFDPERNCFEKERIHLTFQLLTRHVKLAEKKAVDLGCGKGTLTKLMAEQGAQVDAVDISSVPLNEMKKELNPKINAIQDLLPITQLLDENYDVVLATEVIGYLAKEERRLFFSELSRLIKADGFVVCSTGLDINTDGALPLFSDLVETEFDVTEWHFSYHRLAIRLKNFLEIPRKHVAGAKSPQSRSWWYRLSTSRALMPFWNLVSLIATPFLSLLNHNETIMHALEKVCRFFYSDLGISQAIFIGQRRPLVMPTTEEAVVVERKHKKQVWE